MPSGCANVRKETGESVDPDEVTGTQRRRKPAQKRASKAS